MKIGFWIMIFLFASICSKSEPTNKAGLETVLKYTILDTNVKGQPSKTDQIKDYAKENKIELSQIADVLIGFAEKNYKEKGEEAEALAIGSIYELGELRCKSALVLLHKVLKESTDDNIKYNSAVAILKIEDDPVPFIKDIFNGKLLSEDFKYRYSLFEKVRDRTKEEIEKPQPNELLIKELKEFLIKTVANTKEETGTVMRIDKFLSYIDKEYDKLSERRKMLEERMSREETKKVKVWKEYFSSELDKMKE